MACEAEQEARNNAFLAFTTSLLALEQAVAVVEANLNALAIAEAALAACLEEEHGEEMQRAARIQRSALTKIKDGIGEFKQEVKRRKN